MSKRWTAGRHLDDGAFAELWAAAVSGDVEAGGTAAVATAHLNDCAACRSGYDEFTSWADSLRDEANAEADEAFTPERLTAQQAHILRRLEALGRPARVIAFPKITRPISTQHSGARRWIAAAAVAGLVLGLAGGQMFDLRRRTTRTPDATTAAARITDTASAKRAGGYQPVSLTTDEAALMDLVADRESASSAHTPAPLRALDELTPHARDYDRPR